MDLKAAALGEAPDSDYGVGGFGGLQELKGLNKPVRRRLSTDETAPRHEMIDDVFQPGSSFREIIARVQQVIKFLAI